MAPRPAALASVAAPTPRPTEARALPPRWPAVRAACTATPRRRRRRQRPPAPLPRPSRHQSFHRSRRAPRQRPSTINESRRRRADGGSVRRAVFCLFRACPRCQRGATHTGQPVIKSAPRLAPAQLRGPARLAAHAQRDRRRVRLRADDAGAGGDTRAVPLGARRRREGAHGHGQDACIPHPDDRGQSFRLDWICVCLTPQPTMGKVHRFVGLGLFDAAPHDGRGPSFCWLGFVFRRSAPRRMARHRGGITAIYTHGPVIARRRDSAGASRRDHSPPPSPTPRNAIITPRHPVVPTTIRSRRRSSPRTTAATAAPSSAAASARSSSRRRASSHARPRPRRARERTIVQFDSAIY